jgi:heterotetrameric sarcosine oxidase gamma subunit
MTNVPADKAGSCALSATRPVVGVEACGCAMFGLVEISSHVETSAETAALCLPSKNKATMTSDLTILWVGPGRWYAVAEKHNDTSLIDRLRARLIMECALVDLSDAKLRTRVWGSRARELLAAGSTVDFRASHFGAGDCAMTALGEIPVAIHACAQKNCFDIYVDRSLGYSLGKWFQICGREFGFVAPA